MLCRRRHFLVRRLNPSNEFDAAHGRNSTLCAGRSSSCRSTHTCCCIRVRAATKPGGRGPFHCTHRPCGWMIRSNRQGPAQGQWHLSDSVARSAVQPCPVGFRASRVRWGPARRATGSPGNRISGAREKRRRFPEIAAPAVIRPGRRRVGVGGGTAPPVRWSHTASGQREDRRVRGLTSLWRAGALRWYAACYRVFCGIGRNQPRWPGGWPSGVDPLQRFPKSCSGLPPSSPPQQGRKEGCRNAGRKRTLLLRRSE